MTPARRVLPIFFLVLAVMFIGIPLGVSVWDVDQLRGDPTGATTISYQMVRFGYDYPFLLAMIGMAFGVFVGLVIALFVHWFAGMPQPAMLAELADLRERCHVLQDTVDARGAYIDELKDERDRFRENAERLVDEVAALRRNLAPVKIHLPES